MNKEFWAFVNEHCGRPSEEQLATLYTIWQVARAAQKKRDAEVARKYPAFGIGENIAKAIEEQED